MVTPLESSCITTNPGMGSYNFLLFGIPPIPKLCFVMKCNPPTLSAKCSTTHDDKKSFIVSYLMENCGFSLYNASRISKYMNLTTSETADSVLSLFRSYGFSDSQISSIVRRVPQILRRRPENSISPKFEFLESLGFSNAEVVEAIASCPYLLCTSLKDTIIPAFEIIKDLMASDEEAVSCIKRCLLVISGYNLKGNVQLLVDSGVPHLHIRKLIKRHPAVFWNQTSAVTEGVEKLKKMGFDPLDANFIPALGLVMSLSEERWEQKVDVFKKWGWTEDDVLVSFKKYPNFMGLSVVKITEVMDFLVNDMGCDPKLLIGRARVLGASLENVIVPRSRVVLYLRSKGLIKKHCSLVTPLVTSENRFLQHYIQRFEGEAQHLLRLYGKD